MSFRVLNVRPERRQMPVMPGRKNVGTIKTLPQRGKRKSVSRDLTRTALPPGKRISKSGNEYWETRKNRSDALRSRL